jgi:hypothetical protein
MRALLLGISLSFAGCERGCLAPHLGPSPEPGTTTDRRSAAADLGGTDCSDGLLRCAEGRIEASRIGHVPHPCSGAACECPWEEIGRCTGGCIGDRIEILGDRDAGAQLCRPVAPVARPPLPTELASGAAVCSEEGFRCTEGVVVACARAGAPARRIAVCLYGCDVGVDIVHGSSATAGEAPEILCARATAERR